MKVLNLQCGQRHAFEGWFGSEDDFQSQLARGLVECPMCANKAVVKMPSAPRLNLGGHRAPQDSATEASADEPGGGTQFADPTGEKPGAQASTDLAVVPPAAEPAGPSLAQQAAFLSAVRQVLANTEDVGTRFANQARAMHYGDIQPRSIRGQATPREAMELIDEGIDVMALPVPAALKETLQ